jgi:alanyl aminopeptidase
MTFRLSAALFSAAISIPALLATNPVPPQLRLPGGVRPLSYDVNLKLTPGADSFDGSVAVHVKFDQPSALLWLNAADVKITSAKLEQGGHMMPVTVVPGGSQFAGFEFASPVEGEAVLTLTYSGAISKTSSAGVFEMKEDGNWYLYTQFEPTDARRAFPCFDEPEFKTPWRITLDVPAGAMALANTPPVSETEEPGGRKRVAFAPTQPLPSYLVAFAAGKFEAVSAGKVGRTPLRVIVPEGHAKEAAFAVEAIPQLLQRLEAYFGTPYPFEKLDSIAMPFSDFAMENAGLITYSQDILLGSAATNTIRRQREFAVTAAHEMAHQWFGDEVTPTWWDDIWLNESFATWMERKITAEWKPEWNLDVTRVSESHEAMDLDSLVSARRIREPIVTNDDIANAFDGITYLKGSAVISMFENWLTPQTFRHGVAAYLEAYRQGNATTAQFLASISTAAGRDVAPAFRTFLDQAGVPLVTASLDCSGSRPRVQLSQTRFLPPGAPPAASQVWRIPVCMRYGPAEATASGGTSQCEILDTAQASFPLRNAHSCPAWILPNAGEEGYYRVAYGDGLLTRTLARAGEHLTLAERVGELENLDALTQAGRVPVADALELARAFSSAPERQVVEAAANVAGILKSRAVPDALRPAAARFLRDTFGARAEALGWTPRPGEGDGITLLRQSLVPFVANQGEDEKLIAEAHALALKWLANHSAVDPNMTTAVLTTAAEHGDQALFDKFLAAAREEKDRAVRQRLFDALGSFRDPAIASAALNLLLTEGFDAREAFYPLLFGPLAYPQTRALPFEFVKQHGDSLAKRIPREVGADFAAALSGTGGAFCSAARRDEVQAFFQPRVSHYTGGPRTLKQTIEGIDDCIARRSALEPGLTAFLRDYAAAIKPATIPPAGQESSQPAGDSDRKTAGQGK